MNEGRVYGDHLQGRILIELPLHRPEYDMDVLAAAVTAATMVLADYGRGGASCDPFRILEDPAHPPFRVARAEIQAEGWRPAPWHIDRAMRAARIAIGLE